MPLTVSQANGQYVVNGVTRDPSVTSPLGRAYFQVGPHLLGYDDNFAEPVIVRAYYDPLQDPGAVRAAARGAVQYIGYLQFMRLSFRGTPIPPDVYGGRLADRAPYTYGDDLRFVDFMGPSDAQLRGIYTPFYPYNALLINGDLTANSDFFYHPLENGSLRTPAVLGTGQSLAASLFGEISPGLSTPADVAKCLTPGNQILLLSPSESDLAQSEAYRIALNSLETTPLPSAPTAGAPLAGLDETQVAAQVIGDYVLLTLPDPEDLGDTVVISTQPRDGGGTDVVVHLISDYDLEGMTGDAARAALWRIREYQLDQGLVDAEDLDDAPSAGRGRSGLLTPPFRFSPGEFALELRYWTLAVAVTSIGARGRLSRYTLSGFTWSAMFQFDEDTGSMDFAAIRQPQLIDNYALTPGLRAFSRARDSMLAADQDIDTSNFTKAAMRRDNFGGGSKLRFVDASGNDLT
jgi:hypothetical protein